MRKAHGRSDILTSYSVNLGSSDLSTNNSIYVMLRHIAEVISIYNLIDFFLIETKDFIKAS